MQERFVEEESKELKSYWYLLLENKYLFLAIFLIVFASVSIVTFLTKPIYQSGSTILIESKNYGSDFFSLREMNPRQTIINNHIEMIKSRSLLKRVVESLSADSVPDSIRLKSGDFSDARKASRISGNLSVIPVKDTDILKIVYRDVTPYNAYYIANLITEEYYRLNLEMTRGELSEVGNFLKSQLSKIETDLSLAEENLKKYKEGKSVVVLSEETNMLVRTLSKFQEEYKTNEVELNTLQKRSDVLNRNLDESQKFLAEGILNTKSPTISRLINEVAALEADYASYLAQGYDKNHPKNVELKNRIDNTKKQIIDEAKTMILEDRDKMPIMFSEDMINSIISLQVEIETKKATLETLNQVVLEYEKQLGNVPVKELELARLERDKRVSEELYLMLRNKYEEARIAEAGQLGSIKIVDRAVLSSSPILPKTRRNLILGFFLALIVSAGIVLLKEYIDDSVRNIDELERQLKIKIIGSIPFINTKNGNGSLRTSETLRRTLISEIPDGSPTIEAYKILRTNILYLSPDDKIKSITVSSATKGEGKSTTVINLGITLSQLGKRVLLVDADLRKPVLSKVLDVQSEKGLVHMIREEDDYKSYIKETGFKNLYLIPHGEKTMHSTEIFESHKMQHVITTLENDFDYIIYDSPPMLSVADPAIIARYTDGILWVVQFKRAKKQELVYTKKMLTNLNTNILGFVLNNINMTSPYGRYYYNYYYHYYESDTGDEK